MPKTREHGSRSRRYGALVAAAALATMATPAVAVAQETDPVPPPAAGSDTGSVEGLIPEEIVLGPGLGGGSEALRDVGSGAVPDAALSAGQSAGSVAPLEALGSTGGSAAASVASSGILPGSTYVNTVGSIGSGTIGLGSLAIPEYAIAVLGVQFLGGYFTALGERQEVGELYPHEIDFWNDVVVGSATGGALLEDAAAQAGTQLPGGLAGSIDAVQRSALEDPFEANERRRAEAEAAAEAEELDGTGTGAAVGDADQTGTAGAPDDETSPASPVMDGDDDEVDGQPTEPVGGTVAATGGTGGQFAPLERAAAQGTQQQTAAPATLASTGVEATTVAGLAAVSVLLGAIALAFSRRRA